MNDTEYLLKSKANKKHLLEAINSKTHTRFTPKEFDEYNKRLTMKTLELKQIEVYKNKDINFKYANEQWREYPENPQYLVSFVGRIKSKEQKVNHNYGGIAIKKERILTQSDNGRGYLSVGLTMNGETKTIRVGRMVAITWVPNPENKPQVNHKNGIKSDNRAENLEWATSGENIMHAWNNGLAKKASSYIELQKRVNQILQYACHDVKVQTPKGNGRVVIDAARIIIKYTNGQQENLIKSIRFWGNDFKLVLYDLSWLTKEIEHNGEKFVPVIEWDWANDIKYFNPKAFKYRFNNYYKFEQLVQHHFDVFELIPAGFAIDKSTIK